MKRPARVRFSSRTCRLISSRYPTIGVFDDIAGSEDDLRAAFELEDLTNTRRTATERLRMIPGGEVAMGGHGANMVMAAFLHSDASGGRFHDHRLGAWYASTELETALAETIHHHERRLSASAGGYPNRIQMRELVATFDDEFIDVRGLQSSHPALYDPNDYAGSQAFIAGTRWPFSADPVHGVIFDSVRRAGGTNICVLRPLSVSLPVEQGDHFEYVWDASGRRTVLKLTNVTI